MRSHPKGNGTSLQLSIFRKAATPSDWFNFQLKKKRKKKKEEIYILLKSRSIEFKRISFWKTMKTSSISSRITSVNGQEIKCPIYHLAGILLCYY
jgi:hypothetical protein